MNSKHGYRSSYKCYSHKMCKTKNRAEHDKWGSTLGLKDLNGAMIVDLQGLKGSWVALDF